MNNPSKRASLLDEAPPADRECPTGGTALTVTLKPMFYELKPLIQYQRTKFILLKLAKKYKLSFLYLVPELTPQEGNIHYHGVYKSVNVNDTALFLRAVGKQIGFKVTKYIDNEIKWNQYIHKSKLYSYDYGQYAIISYPLEEPLMMEVKDKIYNIIDLFGL